MKYERKNRIEYLNRIYKNLIHQEQVKRSGYGGNKNEDLKLYMDRIKRIEELVIKRNRTDILKYFYFERNLVAIPLTLDDR